MARQGLLIEIEGPDGSGKSTQISMLKSWLMSKGRSVEVLRSPGGSEFGEEIRPTILSGPSRPPMSDLLVIAGLVAANTVQAAKNQAAGIDTIFDRRLSSFYAYEGALGIPESTITKALELIGLAPGRKHTDAHIILDVDYHTGLIRLKGAKKDNWEKRGQDYFEKVRALYLKRIYEEQVIDASGGIEDVQAAIRNVIEPKLNRAVS